MDMEPTGTPAPASTPSAPLLSSSKEPGGAVPPPAPEPPAAPLPPLPPVAPLPPGPWDQLPPPAPEPVAPRYRLRRSRSDRMLGGVLGGAAATFGVDAALLRIAIVALTVLGFGAGALLYLAAWIVVPEEEPAA